NFGWTDIDLEGVLHAELGLPVLVANDANAAVLAEYTFGGADDDVLLVRVGRGVGSGLLTGGQPLRGSRFAAGEIG
ncbi:ROK family protein, partial [Rhizobium johnstonii]